MERHDSSNNWFAQINYLHYLYVIFILLVALVVVISYYHCSEKDKSLHEFISFAATLSSIILSVLAIFITVMSGESTNKLRDGIMGLLRIPENLTEQVNQSVQNLNKATTNLDEAAKANEKVFRENSKEFQNAIENLKSQIGENFTSLGNKIDAFTGKQRSLNEAIDNNTIENKEGISDQQIDSFLLKTSSLSLVFIYVVDQYLKKNIVQPISLLEITKRLGFSKESGVNSYLIACIVFFNAFGLIQYKQKSKDDIDLIYFYSISDSLRNRYMTYLEKYKESSDQDEIDEYLDSLAKDQIDTDADSEQK